MRPVMPLSVICVWLFLAAISAPTTVRGTPINDTSGNPLLRGVRYYIVASDSESGGGVVPFKRCPGLCPADVGLLENTSDPGRWVLFSSFSGLPVLQVGEELSIEFTPYATTWLCPNYSTIWSVREDSPAGLTYISTGGALCKPNSRFMIQVEGDAYKIVHSSSDSSDEEYRNVGVLTDNSVSVQSLILSVKPVLFQFERLLEKHGSEKNMLKMLPFY